MHLLSQILFLALLLVALVPAIRRYRIIRRNIALGKDRMPNDHRARRWRNMLLFALGQKKMFRKPLPAILHFFIYAGFIIVNIEVLEIIVDGLSGSHRFFEPYTGKFYFFLISFIELLSALALVATIIFLIRRNIIHVKRFTQPELKGWPFRDANFILLMELILVTAILTMNAADTQLYARGVHGHPLQGHFLISQFTSAIFAGTNTHTLELTERSFWWIHIAGIFFFLNYIPYSKHLHIFLAFPNAYYAGLESKGKMRNMPTVEREVRAMLQPDAGTGGNAEITGTFGANDVAGLRKKQLLDAYSCTECGRCTAACPANLTGKKLSPRKIMMDTRDRLEEYGRLIHAGKEEEAGKKKLLGDYISAEELHACTTCNACVEECPVNINPLSIILELRRYLVMEQSSAPAEWNQMFSNLENNQAPWQFGQAQRMEWENEL